MNTTILTGRLGRDPETRSTNTGAAVSNFSIAVNGGKDVTFWFNIVAFGKTAELVQQYLTKGSKVGIEGRLQTRTYEKDGQTKTVFEVVANRVEFLDSMAKTATAGAGTTEITDEDVPF